MDMVANLEAMLARGQDTPLLRYSLGNEYSKQQNYAAALPHYARAVELDPLYSAGWKAYGKALAANQQNTEAIEAYWRGIAAAEQHGDIQAAKEMNVFLKRLQKG